MPSQGVWGEDRLLSDTPDPLAGQSGHSGALELVQNLERAPTTPSRGFPNDEIGPVLRTPQLPLAGLPQRPYRYTLGPFHRQENQGSGMVCTQHHLDLNAALYQEPATQEQSEQGCLSAPLQRQLRVQQELTGRGGRVCVPCTPDALPKRPGFLT